MSKVFKEVPVEHKHVGKVMFATGLQGDKFCGKIEFYGREGFNSPELFVCSHAPDPKDPYKTTGTRIRFVLEEVEEVEHNPLVEVCDRVDAGEVRSKRTYAKFKNLIKRNEDN